MGLGPPIIALYHQLKELGLFDDVKRVVELGSQNVWCPQRHMMRDLFRAFGRDAPSEQLIDDFANWKGAARDLYENLGLEYACIDVDDRFGSLMLDLNFDEVPAQHQDRYDLTTNHGTSEHILNQYNVFKMVHDLTRRGGLMLHAVPFTVHLEHGFLNYQPNFFSALAWYNGYEPLGVWVGPDWQLSSLIPWDPAVLDYLVLSSKTTHLLVVLQRKLMAGKFRVPQPVRTRDSMGGALSLRYCYGVDAEYYEGARDRFVTTGEVGLSRPLGRPSERAVTFPSDPPAEEVADEPCDGPGIDASVGPPVIAILRQLKALGTFDSVHSVVELGSRPVDAIPRSLVLNLFRAFGRPDPTPHLVEGIVAGGVRPRELYEALGLQCTSVALDGGPDALKLDLNFDPVPVDHKHRYDLATNVGTSEYLLNQLNVFKTVHDFTRPWGFMLHAVPFTVQLERAFFNYQPNFFDALARYNSYRTLGMWVGVDARVPSLIAWQPGLLDYLAMSVRTSHVLVVLFQKMYANEFCVPFQGCYESMVPKRTLARYRMVVDGMYSDGAKALETKSVPTRHLTAVPESTGQLTQVPGIELVREVVRRVGLRVRNVRTGRFRQALARPVLKNRG
jgi:hypothetical protein